MAGFWKGGRCGGVAVSGGSTVVNANVSQATASPPEKYYFLGGEKRPLEIRLCSQG